MTKFGTFKDERDGYVYKTVRIGKQTWLAENFRYDCAGSKVYENDDDNLDRYGRLYTWRTAMSIAPEGWRLPGKEDWKILTNQVGGKDEGKALKSRTGWEEDGGGTDKFGFDARPGGYVDPGHKFVGGAPASDEKFISAGEFGFWWGSEEIGRGMAFYWSMSYFSDSVIWHNNYNDSMCSVRFLLNNRLWQNS